MAFALAVVSSGSGLERDSELASVWLSAACDAVSAVVLSVCVDASVAVGVSCGAVSPSPPVAPPSFGVSAAAGSAAGSAAVLVSAGCSSPVSWEAVERKEKYRQYLI